jgi:energy-coupling factor transport system substrate-specific component
MRNQHKGLDIITVWGETKMVTLIALSAAVYAVARVMFMGFVLVPGHTEFRVASVFPIIFGILFGPAGAWGSAIGNLIGDFFGTLSLGAIGGFVANFFLAYVPYKLWGRMLLAKEKNKAPTGKGAKQIMEFILVAIAADLICTTFVGGWVSLTLKLVPYKIMGPAVAFNNIIAPAILGPILLIALYPRLEKWGLLWYEIMDKDINDRPKGILGVTSIWIAALGTLATVFLVLANVINETTALYIHIPLFVLAFLALTIKEKDIV